MKGNADKRQSRDNEREPGTLRKGNSTDDRPDGGAHKR